VRPSQRPDRGALIERLGRETFDLVVIGGGITGAWIALDAAMRGLSVGLVEQGDFASGSSSRSSRFVHGGLRYLRYRHFSLVRESLRERGLLLHLAPHLVRPFPFLLPVYRGSRDSALLLRIGLSGYDLLAGTLGIGRHRARSKEQLMQEEPALRTDGLESGLQYYDAVTNDSRLTLAVLLGAIDRGAAAANYVQAIAWEIAGGRVAAVNCREMTTGAELTVRGRVIISAGGPWTDELRALSGVSSILRPTKGVHIVVPREMLHTESIIAFNWQGRPLFVVPAGRHTYMGTTDTDWQGNPDGVAADADDVAYLIEAANAYFDRGLTAADVTAAWAGVRPLVADEGSPTPSDVSRDYEILEGTPGVYTICGGKLTSGRSMAEALVDLVIEREGQHFATKPARCRTGSVLLPGAIADFGRYRKRAIADLVEGWGMPQDSAAHLVDTYGTHHVRVLGAAGRDPALLASVADPSPLLLVEAAHAAAHEMAVTLEDFMRRRSDLMLFGPGLADAAVSSVAGVLAGSLGWDDAEKRRQTEAYERSAARMVAFRPDVSEVAAQDR
jgi:glycerol-3-phosphate dehydrogenase